jgi:hypothetical protein
MLLGAPQITGAEDQSPRQDEAGLINADSFNRWTDTGKRNAFRLGGDGTGPVGADAKLPIAKGVPESGSAMRTWTDHTGRRTIQGEYLSGDAQKVKLRLAGGKKVTLRMDQLSGSDQEFVRSALHGKQPPKSAAGKKPTQSAGSAAEAAGF